MFRSKPYICLLTLSILFLLISGELSSQWESTGNLHKTVVYSFAENQKFSIAATVCGIFKKDHNAADWEKINHIETDELHMLGDSIVYSFHDGVGISDLSSVNTTTYIDTNSIPESILLHLAAIDSLIFVSGMKGVHVSTDKGQSYTQYVTGLPLNNAGYLIPNDLEIGGSDVYCATPSGLYKSKLTLNGWQQIGAGSGLPLSIDEIAYYNGELYGITQHDIFKSSDSGQTWNNIYWTPHLIRGTAVLNGHLQVATDSAGVFTSPDSGSTWNQQYQGLQGHRIYSLFIFQSHLYVSTSSSEIFRWDGHWFKSDLPGLGCGRSQSLAKTNQDLYCNSRNKIFRYNYDHWLPIDINQPLNWKFDNLASNSDHIAVQAYTTDKYLRDSIVVFHSSDNGQSWTLRPSPDYMPKLKYFKDTLYAYESDDFYYSADHGVSWNHVALKKGHYEIEDLEYYNGKVFIGGCDNEYLNVFDPSSGIMKSDFIGSRAWNSDQWKYLVEVGGELLVFNREEGKLRIGLNSWQAINTGLQAIDYTSMSLNHQAKAILVLNDIHSQINSSRFYFSGSPSGWQALKHSLPDHLLVNDIEVYNDTLFASTHYSGVLKIAFVDGLVSIPEGLTLQQSPFIYPNPASEFIRLNLPEIKTGQITVFNQMGAQVASYKFDKTRKFDLAHLRPGIYLVVVRTVGEEWQQKLVKL